MKVIVLDPVYVEGYGIGPFINPIELSEKEVNDLRKKSRLKIVETYNKYPKYQNNSYPIKIGKKETVIKVLEETNPMNYMDTPLEVKEEKPLEIVQEVKEEPVVEVQEIKEEEPVVEVQEVRKEEPVVEVQEVRKEEPVVEVQEIKEEENKDLPIVGDGILDTEEELKELTVSELKAKLDEMGVDYLYKDTKSVLIKKVLENL